MSTKFFDTKKSGIVKKNKTMKTGIIVTAILAITTAAGFGGYKLINSDGSPNVASKGNLSSNSSPANNYQSAPMPRGSTGFSSFGEQRKVAAVESKKDKKSKGKHVAKKSKKHGKGKHLAKHSKKHGKGKHLAKHSKKHGKGKHLAKNSKHKKKSNKAQLTSASR